MPKRDLGKLIVAKGFKKLPNLVTLIKAQVVSCRLYCLGIKWRAEAKFVWQLGQFVRLRPLLLKSSMLQTEVTLKRKLKPDRSAFKVTLFLSIFEQRWFLNGPSPASFSFISNKHQYKLTKNLCEKMSIQYTVLGFEPTTFRTTTRPRLPPLEHRCFAPFPQPN